MDNFLTEFSTLITAQYMNTTLDIGSFLSATLVSLVLGLCVALMYMYRTVYTKNFVITLALLPAMVEVVIMMVNGNLGTGVAVLGAFSLVRFRSVPGNAREIACVFFSMAIGLATGMGYLGFAVLFMIIICAVNLIFSATRFGEPKMTEKELKITIPENLDYNGVFDDLFKKYTKKSELLRVRTTNMGSLYELTFHIVLNNNNIEKEFIDEIRCRNGNLNIVCGRVPTLKDEL